MLLQTIEDSTEVLSVVNEDNIIYPRFELLSLENQVCIAQMYSSDYDIVFIKLPHLHPSLSDNVNNNYK